MPARLALEDAVVDDDDGADEEPQQAEELRLREEVGLARLVDELRDLEHRLVHGRVLELRVDDEPEDDAERRDDEAEHGADGSPACRRTGACRAASGTTSESSPPPCAGAAAEPCANALRPKSDRTVNTAEARRGLTTRPPDALADEMDSMRTSEVSFGRPFPWRDGVRDSERLAACDRADASARLVSCDPPRARTYERRTRYQAFRAL